MRTLTGHSVVDSDIQIVHSVMYYISMSLFGFFVCY